jgi:riboflavin-specific deaminase-like protein
MSLDGKISSPARELPSFPSANDRAMMDRIRFRADAVLVGGGTLRAANAPLRIRSRSLVRRRVAGGRSEQPLNVLLSASLKVPLEGRFFTATDTRRMIFTTHAAPARLRAKAAATSEVVVERGRSVNLRRLVATLYRRGVRQLLLEGGGATNFEFFRLGLIDEIYLTLCPLVIGGSESPTPVDGEGFFPGAFKQFAPVRVRRDGGELFLHYRRADRA